ncbi:hypothetical protein ABT117_35795 [Streptomyces sp. NPDC002262]|uniref:hypothetical protein n=1 Tax=Streptomyces sp. NPDC002262 TaxID=3154414 RepID=UPI0033241F48
MTSDARQPARTPDGRYVIVHHRRWRATDPEVPQDVAARLRSHLMAARRAVAAAKRAQDPRAERIARSRVHAAKVALGERGTPWWDQNDTERRARWRDGLAALDENPGEQNAGGR